MDRVKTGIKGFDELVEGGFPRGFNILITGSPGTGKTIFGQQFLYNGAMEGHPGIYVSLDMSDNIFRQQGDLFGWDIEKLEKEDKLSIVKVPLDRKSIRLFDKIREEAKRIRAERLVFDSLASFSINIDQFEVPLVYDEEITKVLNATNLSDRELFYSGGSAQRTTYLTINHLSKLGTTNIIITDEATGNNQFSQLTVDGVSEYVCDGLITLKAIAVGPSLSRTMEIKKMRATKIEGGNRPYDIMETGIALAQG